MLYISLGKADGDLIYWANMLRENSVSVATWIQAVIVAEANKSLLNVGSIYYLNKVKPVRKPVGRQMQDEELFGDDTEDEQKKPKGRNGWTVRGDDNSYIVGSVIVIRVTREAVLGSIKKLKRKKKVSSAYYKAIIRKHLKYVRSPDDELLPDPAKAEEIFALSDIFHIKEETDEIESSYRPVVRKKPVKKEPPSEKSEKEPDFPEEPAIESKPMVNPLLQYIS